jgi:hypothetical protein
MMIIDESPNFSWLQNSQPQGLLVCDLDGTILRSDRTLADVDLKALHKLRRRGVACAIATGRSLYSFQTVKAAGLPVDFIIFSSGAGIVSHPAEELIRKVALEPLEVVRAAEVLLEARLDFMIHHPIPDNHHFVYFATGRENQDFSRRISLYRDFASPINRIDDGFGPAPQLLAILPSPEPGAVIDELRQSLPEHCVIHTTSPLDGKSVWIEVFPAKVSKSQTAAWLSDKLGIPHNRVFAIGNDYNDLDLLSWSAKSYVMANAPAELKSNYHTVASNDEGGVAEAIERWLADR